MLTRLVGFSLGLGVGVGLGVLLAPRSGERTRTLIRNRAADGAGFLKHKGAEIREQASAMIQDGVAAVAQQRGGVEAAVRAGTKAYREAVHT